MPDFQIGSYFFDETNISINLVTEKMYSIFKYFCDKFNLIDYTLENFKFLFIGKSENVPIIFEFTEKWNQAAIKGFNTKSGYFYTGIDENLKKVYYHWKNNKYDFSKDVYEQNGNLILNDNFIEVNEI